MNRKLYLIIVFSGIFIFACGNGEKLKAGNEIIAKVEKFRNDNNKLPDSLSEIGSVEAESSQIHYRKESKTKYIIWFGKTLGESATYDSDAKQWSNL